MSVPMFPEHELILLSDNVFIHHFPETTFKVWFSVGVQNFQIGREHDTEEEARWTAKQLIKALENFKKGTKSERY